MYRTDLVGQKYNVNGSPQAPHFYTVEASAWSYGPTVTRVATFDMVTLLELESTSHSS